MTLNRPGVGQRISTSNMSWNENNAENSTKARETLLAFNRHSDL